ncbi:Pc21g08520 [Penicillium rubens Wisconsin 54-1255]|jgi:hypothetical protein|uniref:Pc21g08520 protein n=1 Tax=Penicillium rubens (strain ATCC 28089 / DSM 1075 / NRRL 1951 / Wisconsin 54-1255) TaxID=500485 RepID=B6HLZ4_PENRW|nr:Pc21g08520 [Penicillium rubens Wisconsin 54-1255]
MEYPPEATYGIHNLSFVWWLNRLFLTGCRKIIGSSDLFNLEPCLRVQKVMRDAFHDCTVFSVAHRICSQFRLFKSELTVGQLDTIIDLDRIAVLDAGYLIEFDSLRLDGIFLLEKVYSNRCTLARINKNLSAIGR